MPNKSAINQILTLKKRAEFLTVAASGNKIVTTTFIVQYAVRVAPADSSVARVGFTATRKLGGAVVRNRAKRRLRALVRQVVGEGGEGFGCDYVFIARSQTVEAEFDVLLRDMRYALGKIGRLLKGSRA